MGRNDSRSKRARSVWWVLIALSLGFVWAGIAVADSHGEIEINRVNPGPVGEKVDVFLTVTDGEDRPISGLTESFTVQVGAGTPSPPTQASPPSEQLSIVFVMDFTTTIRKSGALDALQDATEAFVTQMQPGDYAAIVKFNIDLDGEPTGAKVVSPFQQLVTPSDQDGNSPLREEIYRDYPGAGTNLNAALARALDHIAESEEVLPPGRKAIIVLADGEDNWFEHTGTQPRAGETGIEVRDRANILNVPIFTVGVGIIRTEESWERRMKELASQTGGEYFDAVDEPEKAITDAFATTSNLLTNEYQITFDGVDNCERQDFTVFVKDLGLTADGWFTHRGCTSDGGSGGGGSGDGSDDSDGDRSSGGGGSVGLLELIAGLSLLAIRRRFRKV